MLSEKVVMHTSGKPEIFSVASQGFRNALYEQYLISANTWKKLIQYGIDRQEFKEVDIAAVFDLIVFSYQGVRMYSKLMPIDKEIPSRIIISAAVITVFMAIPHSKAIVIYLLL